MQTISDQQKSITSCLEVILKISISESKLIGQLSVIILFFLQPFCPKTNLEIGSQEISDLSFKMTKSIVWDERALMRQWVRHEVYYSIRSIRSFSVTT